MIKSLSEIIEESDFLKLAQEHSQSFLKIYHFLRKDNKPSTRRFYAHLIEESDELESFLDDHYARDNKTWFYFCEIVACIRNLAKVAFSLRHIINRLPAYQVNNMTNVDFHRKAIDISRTLDKMILILFEELKNESLKQGIKFPRKGSKTERFEEVYPKKRLPYTLDEAESLDAKEIAGRIANQYLSVIDRFDGYEWDLDSDPVEDIHQLVPNRINEERSRELTARIHNLQSTYDHYIKRTPVESQDDRLKRFRGYISLPLHLLTMISWLAHLYQRHMNTTKRDKKRMAINRIIDENKILDIMVNFALHYTNHCLRSGQDLAYEILGQYTEVDAYEISVPVGLGFHLRPASLVAKLAQHYGTHLYLVLDGEEYDAANILSITMAAGRIARKGDKTVMFKGDKRVLEDLKLLAKANYGEDNKGNPTELPPKLAYLWA